MDGYLVALTVITALGCGLNAGVFFAFSSFVMQALARLPQREGVAAMQAVNVTAVTPVFMTALFGTALACIAVLVAALANLDESFAGWLIGGSAIYLVGTIAVTIAFNVPRNDALEAVEPASADAARLWPRFLAEWTAWNHVRTAASLAATAALIGAIAAT
jgi:uncharacterized membrane protein